MINTSMVEIVKLRRERTVDAVYEALTQAILEYAIKPDERLNIEELADKLGVSLTPVRSAMQRLATEGLVEIRPRSGRFVASLTAQDVEETPKIRCALECLAAEDAARNLSAQDIRHLRERLRSLHKQLRNAEDRKEHERDKAK